MDKVENMVDGRINARLDTAIFSLHSVIEDLSIYFPNVRYRDEVTKVRDIVCDIAYERFINKQGYVRRVNLNGLSGGCSELLMHVRKANVPAIFALVREDRENYAFVKLADGSWTDGCFHVHRDDKGNLISFSLS